MLRLSNSEMKLWRSDKRYWYLRVYLSLAPAVEEEPYSSISIGNLVHDALAQHYDPEVRADPVAYVENIIAQDLEAMPTMESMIRKEGDLVVAMLSGYMEWLADTGVDGDLIIEGTEQRVEVPLVEGINLISKLDAPVLRERDGARLALEHKTVSSLETPLALLKVDTQMLTEHLARFLHAQGQGMTSEEAYDSCHGILYNMLRKVKRTASAKPPFYGREDVPHNIHELRNHWKHCVAVGREILAARARLDAGESHHAVCPPNPGRDSTWSNPFLKVYAMMDDGSDWEDACSNMYVQSDYLERYEGAAALVS